MAKKVKPASKPKAPLKADKSTTRRKSAPKKPTVPVVEPGR